MFKNKYRIIIDSYAGFEAQVRYWWSPFWKQLGRAGVNTHSSVESAERYCKNHANKVVKYVEI